MVIPVGKTPVQIDCSFSPHSHDNVLSVKRKLPVDILDQISDSVSVISCLEPVTMTTLRLMKSEAIRVSKSLIVAGHRAYDSMSCADLVLIIHLALRRRAESELTLTRNWALDHHVSRLQQSLTLVANGYVHAYQPTFIDEIKQLVLTRLRRFNIIGMSSYQLPVGNPVF